MTYWPQVGRYPAHPLRWPEGVALIALGAALVGCGGNDIECAPGYVLDDATQDCIAERKDAQPVPCAGRPEVCQ